MEFAIKVTVLLFVFSSVFIFSPCVYAAQKESAKIDASADSQGGLDRFDSKKEERAALKAQREMERLEREKAKTAARAKKKAGTVEKQILGAEEKSRDEKKGRSPFDSLNEDSGLDDYIRKDSVFSLKTVDVSAGKVKVLMKAPVGSFQFYAVDDDEKATPLLAGNDEFTSSFYALRAGKREYRLASNVCSVIGARRIEDGGQMVYVIPKVARVIVTYDFLSSSPEKPRDMIKITASVLNSGKREGEFALKSVLDTYLGEQSAPHFYTAGNKKINTQRQLRNYDSEKWILSMGPQVSMQILISGGDVSVPEVVSLATKDLTSMRNWIPDVKENKNFDSVLSYNNSSVCINWRSERLAPGEETAFVYYIAVATGGEFPQGEQFIDGLRKVQHNAKKTGGGNGLSKDDGFAAQENKALEDTLDSEVVGNPFHIEIGDEKLNREYIQSLIDRINALEAEDKMENYGEIMMLNAELDLILDKLRRI